MTELKIRMRENDNGQIDFEIVRKAFADVRGVDNTTLLERFALYTVHGLIQEYLPTAKRLFLEFAEESKVFATRVCTTVGEEYLDMLANVSMNVTQDILDDLEESEIDSEGVIVNIAPNRNDNYDM